MFHALSKIEEFPEIQKHLPSIKSIEKACPLCEFTLAPVDHLLLKKIFQSTSQVLLLNTKGKCITELEAKGADRETVSAALERLPAKQADQVYSLLSIYKVKGVIQSITYYHPKIKSY